MIHDLSSLVFAWASTSTPYEPESAYYCPNSSVFQARLATLEFALKRHNGFEPFFSLLTAIVGEIGNNAFDHNLGNWPDVSGVFFAYDLEAKVIVLADRGHGILSTLKRVKPELRDHVQALSTAFTEVITGRAPEQRGNGLKFVRKAIAQSPVGLVFQTGNARLTLLGLQPYSDELRIAIHDPAVQGCMALFRF